MAQSKQDKPGEEEVEANLSGTWYNELGSEMDLTQSPDGILTGIYKNHAPHSSTVEDKLIGSVGTGTGVPATFGFVVNFEGGKFTTAWSGLYYNESSCANGEELLTTWIMTANIPDCKEYWEAANVGQDRFTRTPQISKAKGRKSLFQK